MPSALQDILVTQPLVLIGLIAHLSDITLQEDIVFQAHRLHLQDSAAVAAFISYGHPQSRTRRTACTNVYFARNGYAGYLISSAGSITVCVRDQHIARCSPEGCALYLFLLTVADAQGLSYYSERTLSARLPLDIEAIGRARSELLKADLIAFEAPFYQVLSLDGARP